MEVIFRDNKVRQPGILAAGFCGAGVPPAVLRRDTSENGGTPRPKPYSSNRCGYLNASPLTAIDGKTMFHCGGMCS